MKAFTTINLIKNDEYVMFVTPENPRGRVIARFKYGRGGMASFMAHLRKNWTVEDYLAKEKEGLAPLQIVNLTGYISSNVKKMLKRGGYPVTAQGRDQFFKDQIKGWAKN